MLQPENLVPLSDAERHEKFTQLTPEDYFLRRLVQIVDSAAASLLNFSMVVWNNDPQAATSAPSPDFQIRVTAGAFSPWRRASARSRNRGCADRTPRRESG